MLLCSEANKKGGFSMKFGTFGPSKLVASATSTPTTPTRCFRCGGIFNDYFIANLVLNVEV